MPEKIFVDWEDDLAVIKFKGNWRIFFDYEPMFLLDYSKRDDTWIPSEGEFRYGTLVVDESNVEQWIESLKNEVALEQVSKLYWENTKKRVQLTFLINFDEKFWVGSGWHNDQSFLGDYQPQGWTAIEDLALNYLPPNLKGYFV